MGSAEKRHQRHAMTCGAVIIAGRWAIAGMTPRHAVTLEDRHRTGRIIAGAIASAAPGKDRHRTAPAAGIEGRKAWPAPPAPLGTWYKNSRIWYKKKRRS